MPREHVSQGHIETNIANPFKKGGALRVPYEWGASKGMYSFCSELVCGTV